MTSTAFHMPLDNRRVLRPRPPPALPPPRLNGPVTRRLAALVAANPNLVSAIENGSPSPEPTPSPPLRTSSRLRKRSPSPTAEASTRRAAKRARHRRRSQSESDEDSDFDNDGPTQRRGAHLTRIGGRQARGAAVEHATPRKSAAVAASESRRGKPSLASAAVSKPSKSRSGGTLLFDKSPRGGNKNAMNEKEADPETIPPWATLPYHVLVQIFRYAAALLADDWERAKWLRAATGICRAFAEPAITVLYETPPLLTKAMAHQFIALLAKDPATTMFNYRQKVRELRIDPEELAWRPYRGQLLDLSALVTLPRIQSITLYHPKDGPPYRDLDENLRWHYPMSLFDALNGVQTSSSPDESTSALSQQPTKPTRLTEWHWNRRMMGSKVTLSDIKSLHQTPAFSSLKKVTFLNYQLPSMRDYATSEDVLAARDKAFVAALADAINALPKLEHLTFESSTAVCGQLLAVLPRNLKTLEITNCWDVDSDALAEYLTSGGKQLRQLLLRYNQSLSLAFLVVLRDACPNLRTLVVDLKTYRHHTFYDDSDPEYSAVLEPTQTPTWPESLEVIELKNMRKWTAEGAETLFRSLVDAAPNLSNLRRIDLKAMLDIPYRQRSKIRDRWAATLRHVFLRERSDPMPLSTIHRRKEEDKDMKMADVEEIENKSPGRGRRATNVTPSRKSARLAAKEQQQHHHHQHQQQMEDPFRPSNCTHSLRSGVTRPSYVEPDTDIDLDSDADSDNDNDNDGQPYTPQKKRKSSSNTISGNPTPRLASLDDEDSSQPGSPFDPSELEGLYRQGLCDVVEIQLDNQKPAETMFVMDDFLDDEPDDLEDEEWDGVDDFEFQAGGWGWAW